MKFDLIILRYGEIALKAKATRTHFENVLISNIKNALKIENIECRINKEWGRIYIYSDELEKSKKVLKKIFGIHSFSLVLETKSDIDSISKLSLYVSNKYLDKNKTFAVRTTRTGKHEYSSQDVSVKIGSDIVEKTKAKVNLSDPDFELFIEIRNDKAFIFTEKANGMGGMPYGTQGRALSLIDDYKSILASWFLIRRGCNVFYLVTDEKIMEPLINFANNYYLKLNYNISSKNDLFEIAKQKKCNAIIAGNCLCIKPEKEMSDIKKIVETSDIPILYPLISMNIDEIDKKCQEIGLEI